MFDQQPAAGTMTPETFATLGGQRLAYIKAIRSEDAGPIWISSQPATALQSAFSLPGESTPQRLWSADEMRHRTFTGLVSKL